MEINGLYNVYYFTNDPRGNGILIVYKCEVIGGQLGETEEAKNPTYFVVTEIPEAFASGGHDQAIREWQNQQDHEASACSLNVH